MSAVSQRTKIEYFDYLRLLATFSVILIHVTGPYWSDFHVAAHKWQALNLYMGGNRWAVPIFMMISGVLFLGSTRPITEIIKRNILRIVTAFVFWSAIYTGICYAKGQLTVPEAVFAFAEGYYHMWYLPIIVGLYLAVPILRKIAESETVTRYFLLAAFFVSSLFPAMASFLNWWSPNAGALINKIVNQIGFSSVAGYSIYFLLGYYLHNKQMDKKQEKTIYAVGILSFLVTVLGGSVMSVWQQTPVHMFYDYLQPNVVCCGAALFVFAKYHFRYGACPAAGIRVIQTVCKHSFGAYLIHPLLLDVLRYNLGLNVMAFHPIISVPLVALGLLMLSLALSAVLSRIPILGKYIV